MKMKKVQRRWRGVGGSLAGPLGRAVASGAVWSLCAGFTAFEADAASSRKGPIFPTYIDIPPTNPGSVTPAEPPAPPPAPAPKPAPPTAVPPAETAVSTVTEPPAGAPSPALDQALKDARPALQDKPHKPLVLSLSGDFLLGYGNVTLPIGYSLAKSLGQAGLSGFSPMVAMPDRNSTYWGSTLSALYDRKWGIEFSYAQGSSSGNTDLPTGGKPSGKPMNSSFSINDTIYNVSLRREFLGWPSSRFMGYLRLGFSYVDADMAAANTSSPAGGKYEQTDKTQDYLGSLGIGVRYNIIAKERWTLDAFLEGEGFGGTRSQQSLETLPSATGLNFETADINNMLYGASGRFTMQFNYHFKSPSGFLLFANAGAGAKYTLIDYSENGTQHELLWGPYVRLGIRYRF